MGRQNFTTPTLEPETEAKKEPPTVREDPVSPSGDRWIVTLVKGDGDVVGLDVDWGDMDKLRVTKIKEGLMNRWNTQNPQQMVKAGDYIVDINGSSGDAKSLLEVVKANSRLEM